MHDVAITDPCVVFPLRRESAPFLGEFRPQQRFPGSPCWARFCGPAWLGVLVLETGVGGSATEAAAQWLLGSPMLQDVPYRPKLVLAAGFAGALREDLRVGDVVLANEILDADGKVWPATWPGTLPGDEWRPPLHRCRLATAQQLLTTSAEKEALRQGSDAAAVDMETAVLARHCKQRGIPFGCVRAISDDLHTALSPELVQLVAGGRVSLGRLLAALVGRPQLASELWRLAGTTRLAARQLGLALGELLTLTLSWGNEL